MAFLVTSGRQHRRSYRLRASCPCGAWLDLTAPTKEKAEELLAIANGPHEDEQALEKGCFQ